MDDIGAILVIAVFYTEQRSIMALIAGIGVLVVLALMRILGVQTLGYYAPWAVLFWFAGGCPAFHCGC